MRNGAGELSLMDVAQTAKFAFNALLMYTHYLNSKGAADEGI